jgi:DNA repair protein RecN (Recombination protein N)
MLRYLSIRNLAVIEALEIEFGPGLNVLTGETGAGKSILVEAVGLLVGGRASPDLIRTGEETATVQAIFDQGDGEELIVRREISDQGRSRAFVNGTLTTAAGLKELGARLADLHGQHEHQALLDARTHLDLLDAYGDFAETRAALTERYAVWRGVVEQLEQAERDERDKAARIDLLTFQLGELDRAALKPGEDEELLALRQVLASADKVQRLCAESYGILYEQDGSVLAGLGGVWRRVGELASIDPRFGAHLESRDAIKSQLEELAVFLRSYADELDASPARLQEVEDRLALVERLKRKYGPTMGDVLARHETIGRDLANLESAGERIAALRHDGAAARGEYLAAARELSRRRREMAPRFSARLVEQLADLAMERTRFEVRFRQGDLPEGQWTDRGVDEAEFYVSPNPGEDLRPLARIASGGELSRLMLALKTVASTDAPGKTLIFDEVDAGIGGRVADAVGAKLRALGRSFQVLCITHLPQISAYSGMHFHISKCIRDGRTVTLVERLGGARRVEEIARMMGGALVSDATRRSARDLLVSRQGDSEAVAKGESESRRQGESETAKAKLRKV